MRYRITLKKHEHKWVRIVSLNGTTIGHPFPNVKAAIDYVEHTEEQHDQDETQALADIDGEPRRSDPAR